MRFRALLLTLLLWPTFLFAEIHWEKFGIGGIGDKQTLKIGEMTFIFRTRDVSNADFKEDHLLMTVRFAGQKPVEEWVESSYGQGAVAVSGNLLFLKYGVGRGTFARVEHVKVLRLQNLQELADVQSSYYISTDPYNGDPKLLEYKIEAQATRDYTTLHFSLPKKQHGIPSEKFVKLKNDD